MMNYVKKLLLFILAFILIFEEWLWQLLTLFGNWLFRILHLTRFELWLSQASPLVAMISFAIPIFIITPLNLLALWMLAHGFIIKAIVIEIMAKMLGMLIAARVFALTKRQLMSFRWFSIMYTTIVNWLTWAHAKIASLYIYKTMKEFQKNVVELFTKHRK